MKKNKVNTNVKLPQLKELKARVEIVSNRMQKFSDKYNKLVQLIEKTDGINKIPEPIKNIGGRITNTKTSITNPSPNILVSMESVVLGITACEIACDALCKKYEPIIDELIGLYTEKSLIIEKMKQQDKKSADNMQNDVSNSRNYKMEAIKIIDLFETFGVMDESELKNSHGKSINLDKKGKDCLKNLRDVINNVSPTEISSADIVEIKDVLSKLSRMNMLSEEAKNREYESIEEYIGKLAGRNMRIVRQAGEDISNDKVNDKLDSMKMLGSVSIEEITDDDLLKFAGIKKENLDRISLAYLHGLVNSIRNLTSSQILSEDIIKIREVLMQLGKIQMLDEESKKKAYEDVDDYIEELENRRGRSK